MAEPTTSAGIVAATACTATVAWLCVVQDVALQLLGVPLSVLLGGLTGALGARYFLPPMAFWPAAAGAGVWTIAAAILAEMLRWMIQELGSRPVPSGALAGIALVTAALGPHLLPVIIERAPAALRRLIDSIKGGRADG
jgi:apolipoprotein N-acyltransferase